MEGYKTEFLEDFRERIIKHFMDVFILVELSKGKSMSGFDFIKLFNKQYDIMLSSGTVYSQLYALERKEMLRGTMVFRKVVYSISEKGQKLVPTILQLNQKILECMESLR